MTVRISPKTVKKDFFEKLKTLSGQNVQQCIQCGTCSGSCPMVDTMDAVPRRIMHMAQLGLEEALEKLNTCWVCASCHTCNVRCPRGIDLPKIMEVLRQSTLRKNLNYIEPSRLSTRILEESPQIALVAAFRKLTG